MLLTFAIVCVGSCLGMGCLVGRKLKTPVVIGVASVGAAIVWPALLIVWAVYEARHYRPYRPTDLADAPGLLVMSALYLSPMLFVISLVSVLVGVVIGIKSQRKPSYTPS
jgi:hypothetical protein